jgi:hypothetical protein
MSATLFKFARSFVNGRLTADEFANAFLELWKIERDSGLLRADEDRLSVCLSSIFCVADLYNPDSDRDAYELDSTQLRIAVDTLIQQYTG